MSERPTSTAPQAEDARPPLLAELSAAGQSPSIAVASDKAPLHDLLVQPLDNTACEDVAQAGGCTVQPECNTEAVELSTSIEVSDNMLRAFQGNNMMPCVIP